MIEIKKFWAPWCSSCKLLNFTMESVKEKTTNTKFTDIEVDSNKEIAAQYSIRSLPTVVIEKDGKELDRIIGNQHMNKYIESIGKLQ